MHSATGWSWRLPLATHRPRWCWQCTTGYIRRSAAAPGRPILPSEFWRLITSGQHCSTTRRPNPAPALRPILDAPGISSANLTSNSIESIRAGLLAGVGIGMFTKASLIEDLSHPDMVTIFDDYVQGTRDISFGWPKRRLVSARVRHGTGVLAASLERRISSVITP